MNIRRDPSGNASDLWHSLRVGFVCLVLFWAVALVVKGEDPQAVTASPASHRLADGASSE